MSHSDQNTSLVCSANFRRARHERTWEDEGFRLLQAIETNQWFLNARFSLDDLSKKVGLNASYTSRALNVGLGKSFKTVLNGYRVEYAASQIQQDNESLLTIALKSGFGSKASFNRIFLEFMDETPSEYRFRYRREHGYAAQRR